MEKNTFSMIEYFDELFKKSRKMRLVERLLLTLFLIFISFPCYGQRVNIKNPGFELDSNKDNIPDGWTLIPSKKARHKDVTQADLKSWYLDRGISHSGSVSIKAGHRSPGDNASWVQTGIMLPEETKFLRVTAWIKSENIRTSAGLVAVEFKNSRKNSIGKKTNVIRAGSNHDWLQHVGYVEVPSGTVSIDLKFHIVFAFVNSGNFWLDDVQIETVEQIHTPLTYYRDDAEVPKLTPGEKSRGFILFSREHVRVLMRNAVPRLNERVNMLNIKACPGEYEPATFALFALDDIQGLNVSVSDFKSSLNVIRSDAIDLRSVHYMTRAGQGRWGIFQETIMHDVPMFLEKKEKISITKGNNQLLWLTVKVPENARPGRYSGTVDIKTKKTKTQIPVNLEVYPFKLSEPEGITYAMYQSMCDDAAVVKNHLSDLRAHGMTTLALYGRTALKIHQTDNKLMINWDGQSSFEKYMQEYKRQGFTEPVLWLMSGETRNACLKLGKIESNEFANAYIDLIKQIQHHAKARGWPEIIYQPIDEPFEHEHRLQLMYRLSALLKTIPGLRIEADGMNGKWENFSDRAYRLHDVLTFHDGPMIDRHRPVDMDKWWEFSAKAKVDKKLLWYYNIDLTAWHTESVRYMSGYGLWNSRADGIIEWCYMINNSTRAYPPGALLYRFPENPEKQTLGGPTLGYEAIREGIDDYRYLITLEQILEKVYLSGDINLIEKAHAIYKPIYNKLKKASFDNCTGVACQGSWTGKCEILPNGDRIIRGQHKLDNNLIFEDYRKIREMIADAIIKIQNLRK